MVTLARPLAFQASRQGRGYWCLYSGPFCFSLGNGTCEAVINPLTATLFPKNKTHWLNILHAGWPGGLVLGALLGLLFNQFAGAVRWEIQMGHRPGADAALRLDDGRPALPEIRGQGRRHLARAR